MSLNLILWFLRFLKSLALSPMKMELKVNDDLSYVKGQVGAKNNYVKLKPEKFW